MHAHTCTYDRTTFEASVRVRRPVVDMNCAQIFVQQWRDRTKSEQRVQVTERILIEEARTLLQIATLHLGAKGRSTGMISGGCTLHGFSVSFGQVRKLGRWQHERHV